MLHLMLIISTWQAYSLLLVSKTFLLHSLLSLSVFRKHVQNGVTKEKHLWQALHHHHLALVCKYKQDKTPSWDGTRSKRGLREDCHKKKREQVRGQWGLIFFICFRTFHHCHFVFSFVFIRALWMLFQVAFCVIVANFTFDRFRNIHQFDWELDCNCDVQ